MSTFGIFEGLGHSAGFEVLGVVKGGYKVHFVLRFVDVILGFSDHG